MNTFLPYPDFASSAKVLDYRRLGKQRVETFQILRAMEGGGWANHPIVHAWRDHRQALILYGIVICREWITRGYRDTMLPRFEAMVEVDAPTMPPWLGDPAFHAAHRSNLLRKDPAWYGQFGWNEPHDLEYIWPR